MTRLRDVTQTFMQTMMSCEEKARLRYMELLRGPTTSALSVGSAVHLGFELGSVEEALKLLEEDRGPSYLEHEAEALQKDRATVQAIVEGGMALWSGWPSVKERTFEVPFVNPATGHASTKHCFSGVFDGVFLPGELPPMPGVGGIGRSFGHNSSPVLLEIKTTSRLDSAYLERLELDWQVSSYLAAASVVYGEPVRHMVYRIAKKPSIRQKKTETHAEFVVRLVEDYKSRPDFYFEEVVVSRTDDQIRRWWFEAWELHERILRIENGGMTVRNSRHCLDFGRCTYFDLCRGAVGPEAFRVLDDAHPELRRKTTP